MTLGIQFHGLDKFLSQDFKAKLPRAMASALNKTASEMRQDLLKHEASDLTTTTKWLQTNTQYEAARSAQGSNMQAEVGILDRVTFTDKLVEGGTRNPLHNYIPIPVEAPQRTTKVTNAHTCLAKSTKRQPVWIEEYNGVLGIWKKKGERIHLMYVLKPKTEYNRAPYLDFPSIIEATATRIKFDELIMTSILKQLGI